MKTKIVQCEHNKRKTWLVRKSKCSHYYVSQAIDGIRIYDFWRCGKLWIDRFVYHLDV